MDALIKNFIIDECLNFKSIRRAVEHNSNVVYPSESRFVTALRGVRLGFLTMHPMTRWGGKGEIPYAVSATAKGVEVACGKVRWHSGVTPPRY